MSLTGRYGRTATNPSSGAARISGVEEFLLVDEGRCFTFNEIANLGPSATRVWQVRTAVDAPVTGGLNLDTDASVIVKLVEDTTYSADGAPLTIYNLNRVKKDQLPVTQILAGATINVPGIITVVNRFIPGGDKGDKGGLSTGRFQSVIMRGGQDYELSVQNLTTQAITIGISGVIFEGDPSAAVAGAVAAF